MSSDLKDRLASIQWHEFTHPCGFDSKEIPSLLIDLNSNSNAVALQAASRLWNVVSHQGNVGSNSVPTAPFLIERLATAPAPLQVEILDILYQFASATHFSNTESWAHQLRVILNDNVARFTQFFDSTDEDIQSFSELIVESLIEAELKPDR